jgi:D-sedoheptulose 7-phosphate isomerase
MNKYIQKIEESINIKSEIIADLILIDNIDKSVEIITESFKKGGKVLFCGNGGSAADAQHLAAEFSGRFYIDRKALNAEALHCNTSYLTAVANDYGYEFIYSRIVDGIGKKGDVLFCISTSGNSVNIINAMFSAQNIGMKVIALTGLSGGEMKNNCDILLNVPSNKTPRIQEAHILLGHIICEFVESNLFNLKK